MSGKASCQESDRPDLSIVLPIYNEADGLDRLHHEVSRVLADLNLSAEIVCTDDGSRDSTWEQIKALNSRDPRVRGLRLSRNFGHQSALIAGMAAARGRAVVTMDSDLQHPPEVIPELLHEWRRGAKIVHTVRVDDARTPAMKRLTSRVFYRLYTLLSGVDIGHGMADFRLLDREVVDTLLALPEHDLFLRGLVHWIGFPSAQVTFKVKPRFAGETKYTLSKMLKFAWAGISAFSLVPLRLAVVLGFCTSLGALAFLVYAIVVRMVTDSVVPGWASAVGIVSLLFGVLFALLGIVGEYIGRILVEVKGRPRFIVMETLALQIEVSDLHGLRSRDGLH